MIRFIDLTNQICDGASEFTFYDTTTDRFIEFSGSQTWSTVEDFKQDFKGSDAELELYINLISVSGFGKRITPDSDSVVNSIIKPMTEDTCIDMQIIMWQIGKSAKEINDLLKINNNMIQPNELRIGNYIIPEDETINAFRVDEISYNEGLYSVEMYIDFPTKDQHMSLQLNNAKDIPLTEKILLKCGFKESAGYDPIKEVNFKGGEVYNLFEEESTTYLYIIKEMRAFYIAEEYDSNIYKRRELKGLHDLQNLYFSLTGKELNIKL